MPETVSIRIGALDAPTGTISVTVGQATYAIPLPLDGAYAPLQGAALRDEIVEQAVAAHHAARSQAARVATENHTVAINELTALAGDIDVTTDYADYAHSMTQRPDRLGRHFKVRVVDAGERTSA